MPARMDSGGPHQTVAVKGDAASRVELRMRMGVVSDLELRPAVLHRSGRCGQRVQGVVCLRERPQHRVQLLQVHLDRLHPPDNTRRLDRPRPQLQRQQRLAHPCELIAREHVLQLQDGKGGQHTSRRTAAQQQQALHAGAVWRG